MQPGPALTVLRSATREAHDRLERRVDALNAFAATTGRRAVVGRYYWLHVTAEAQLAPWVAGISDLDFARRRREPLILAALAELRAAPPAGNAPHFPALRSVAEALGLLYVLEGSSLGGRLILRHLARLGIDLAGLRFLDPYGAAAGERWTGFISVLEREAGRHALGIGQVVSGGIKGFDYAEACLCGEAVAA